MCMQMTKQEHTLIRWVRLLSLYMLWLKVRLSGGGGGKHGGCEGRCVDSKAVGLGEVVMKHQYFVTSVVFTAEIQNFIYR